MTDVDIQTKYFDQAKNRYKKKLVINPPLAQLLELSHLESELGLANTSQLLDFGCGSGRVSLYFLSKGYNVIGVDVSKDSLKTIRHIYNLNYKKGWGKLTTFTQIPAKKRVDGIIGADILHHIDIVKTIPLFKRVLRSGGRVAFSEPNAFYPLWYLHYFLSGIPWDIEKGILQCTRHKLLSMFANANFFKVQVTGHGLLPTRFLSWLPSLCRLNALEVGRLPLVNNFAFRFIISATSLNSRI